MSPRYPFPDLDALPEDIKAQILQVQEKAGFIPNVFLAFARRPAEWRAFFAYHDALMAPETQGRVSSLTKGDREMIAGTVTRTPTSQRDLQAVQEAFNGLQQRSGRPLCQLSALLALSINPGF